MKVLIQGLGEIPATVIFAIEKEKPDITYILCSKYQMELVASKFGYTKKNQDVVEKAAKKTNTKVVFQKCNVFEPKSIGVAMGEIIRRIKPGDDIVINYTGGAAGVKLLLGVSAVVLSKFLPIRIIYALKYKGGLERYVDQTKELTEMFRNLYEFF
jgi:hypothetical protein